MMKIILKRIVYIIIEVAIRNFHNWIEMNWIKLNIFVLNWIYLYKVQKYLHVFSLMHDTSVQDCVTGLGMLPELGEFHIITRLYTVSYNTSIILHTTFSTEII